jgi:hypothetical protein
VSAFNLSGNLHHPTSNNTFSTQTDRLSEASPNNRAGCINSECKNAQIKITKGEFRYAVQITVHEHQSWTYKHWYVAHLLTSHHHAIQSRAHLDGRFAAEHCLTTFSTYSSHNAPTSFPSSMAV